MDNALLAIMGAQLSYTRPGFQAVTITGQVSSGVMLENVPAGSGTYSRLMLRPEDLGFTPSDGDTVSVGSTNYTVFRVELDDIGAAHLVLRKS